MKLSYSFIGLTMLTISLVGCNKKSKTQNVNTSTYNEARFKNMSLAQKEQFLLNANDTDASTSDNFDPVLYKHVMSQLKDKNDPQSKKIEAQLYVKHGVWSMDFGVMHGAKNMRAAVTQSLKDYIHALELEPSNQAAKMRINQILNIYKTMPNKSVPSVVVPKLKQLGFMK